MSVAEHMTHNTEQMKLTAVFQTDILTQGRTIAPVIQGHTGAE